MKEFRAQESIEYIFDGEHCLLNQQQKCEDL